MTRSPIMHSNIFTNITYMPQLQTIKLFFLQEWAEELFNLASNLLVQNTSREACLEKAYVIQTRKHMLSCMSRSKFSSMNPKRKMQIRSALKRLSHHVCLGFHGKGNSRKKANQHRTFFFQTHLCNCVNKYVDRIYVQQIHMGHAHIT